MHCPGPMVPELLKQAKSPMKELFLAAQEGTCDETP
jgi:hypothetical protein